MTLKMDQKDFAILDVLKQNSHYTTRQIAKKAKIPITTVHNRIKKLKKMGVIKRFTVDVDYSKIGQKITAYVLVECDLQNLKKMKKTQADIAKELKKHSLVDSVDIVTGDVDLIIKVRMESIGALHDYLFKKVQTIEGVDKTETLIVLTQEELESIK